jgi:DNA polymerase-1
MDNYFRLYPEILTYMETTKEQAKKNGFVKTMFNRICHLDFNVKSIEKSYLERVVINAPIQGAGADIIKMAMIAVHNELQKYGKDACLLLQIHDELLMEVKDELVGELKERVVDIMEHIVKFDIPLTVNCKAGKNWGEAH